MYYLLLPILRSVRVRVRASVYWSLLTKYILNDVRIYHVRLDGELICIFLAHVDESIQTMHQINVGFFGEEIVIFLIVTAKYLPISEEISTGSKVK